MNKTKSNIVGVTSHRTLKWLGVLSSIITLLLFSWIIIKYIEKEDISKYVTSHWRNVLLATFVYILAWIPISTAWVMIARQCKITTNLLSLLNILYLSQAAKYLPGNIGQYIGRIYLAKRSGIQLKLTSLAMVIEVSAILIACAILTSALFLLSFNANTTITGHWLYDQAIKYTGLLVVFVASILFAFIIRSQKNILGNISSFCIAISLMMLTVICFAISNVIIISSLGEEFDFAIYLSVFSAVVISWFAGFITPGAPAGIGIREVVFFALLNGVIDENSLILTIIVSRFVTVIGDLIAFLTGLVLRLKF